MRLSTYRKLKPKPLEEVLFYDHPSGYDRVHRAMGWLKENPDDPRMLASLAAAAASARTARKAAHSQQIGPPESANSR